MSLIRVILSIIFPPLAVIDKGCGSVLIVFLLTAAGWVSGVFGVPLILNKSGQNTEKEDRVGAAIFLSAARWFWFLS